MQRSPKREGEYLLKRITKKAQKAKAQKKTRAKHAIKKGGQLHQSFGANGVLVVVQSLIFRAAETFEKGCKDFKDEVHSGIACNPHDVDRGRLPSAFVDL